MSHHASGPDFSSPHGDPRLDMTDLYAFYKPGDPCKSIFILNVHPSFAVNLREPTTREPFAPGALYEIHVDNNEDAVADLCFSLRFRSSDDDTQPRDPARSRPPLSRYQLLSLTTQRLTGPANTASSRVGAVIRSSSTLTACSTTYSSAATTSLSTRTCVASLSRSQFSIGRQEGRHMGCNVCEHRSGRDSG
jgi:hypothetical protein